MNAYSSVAIGPCKDRKLNTCASCGTHKKLAPLFDMEKRLYFLCAGHLFILDSMLAGIERAAKAQEAGFRVAR